MKVATFGCSWTYGHSTVSNNLNWPVFLKKYMPHLEVHNYAQAGTSIFYSIHQLQWVKKNNPADFYIFQMTLPARLTYWKDSTDWNSHRVDFHSTTKYSSKVFDAGLQILTAQSRRPSLNTQAPAVKLAKNYFSQINDEVLYLQYDLAVEYIKKNVDFYYMQTEAKEQGYNNILCLEDEFGREYCEKYWKDGSHFGKTGLKRTAEWIIQNAGL